MAYAMGYTDSVSLVTIGAGVATFVVGPVTGLHWARLLRL